MRPKLDFRNNFFEIRTNQEDLKESYCCRNEETLVQLVMQIQHASVVLSHLPYMVAYSLNEPLSFLMFCICLGI